MVIDCDECVMQHTDACDDCFVTFLLDPTVRSTVSREPVVLDDEEAEAMGNLADEGLVPHLRLVPRPRGNGHQDRSSAAG